MGEKTAWLAKQVLAWSLMLMSPWMLLQMIVKGREPLLAVLAQRADLVLVVEIALQSMAVMLVGMLCLKVGRNLLSGEKGGAESGPSR